MIRRSISESVQQAIRSASFLQEEHSMAFIEKAALVIADAYRKGGKILICGNGGSLCDAMHFAEELTGQFRKRRKALAAIALACPGHLTCVANDMGYEKVFSRHIEALGKDGDIVIVLSTSGNSETILAALEQAKSQKLTTIAFLGKEGGKAKSLADLEWIVEGFPYSDRIQEAHMAAIHIIIEMVEKMLFEEVLCEDSLALLCP